MFWVVACGYALIVLMVYSAHQDSWLTVRQMKMMGDAQGLPLIWHMGIWSEALFITPLLGFITWRYGVQWGPGYWILASIAGCTISIGMHMTYVHDKIQGALGGNGHITVATVLHGIYMAAALAILFLFFFATRGVESKHAIPIMWFLMLHVIIGTHTVLKIWAPKWFPSMPAVDQPTAFVWGGSAFGLLLCAWWALR
ncbi:hypothetical protein IT396_02790 [Candidatus Nomurabacteria bacterium]|nr:hypothetical protein [Candidatus Nomurabacteria bacterium]